MKKNHATATKRRIEKSRAADEDPAKDHNKISCDFDVMLLDYARAYDE